MYNSSVVNSTTNITGNVTFPNMPPFPYPLFSNMGWIFGIILTHTVFSLFICLSNMVVLFAFYSNAQLRNTTNMVIMSMAFADFAVGFVVIPLWLYVIHLAYIKGTPYTKETINYLSAYRYIDQSLGLNSVYHLVFLHCLRSYSIVFPLRHRKMSNRPVIIAVLLIWTICIAFPSVTHRLLVPKSCQYCFVYITLISNLGLPLIILSIANFILWKTVTKSARQHQRNDMKILVTIAILIGLLCVCYMPFIITNVYAAVRQPHIDVELIVFLKFLHFSNSGLNPVVYALRNPKLAQTLKKIFCGPQPSRDIAVTTRTRATNNALGEATSVSTIT